MPLGKIGGITGFAPGFTSPAQDNSYQTKLLPPPKKHEIFVSCY